MSEKNDIMRKMQSLVAALVMVTALLSISACKNDDGFNADDVEIIIEESFIVEIIAASLSEDDGGFAFEVDELLERRSEECGFDEEETLSESEEGGIRSIESEIVIQTRVICDENDALERIEYNYTSTRSAALLAFDVENSTSSTWDLFPSDEDYLLAGSYEYAGIETVMVDEENSFDTALMFDSDDLIVNVEGDFLSGTLNLFYDVLSTDERDESGEGILEVIETNILLLDISSFDYLYEIDVKTGEYKEVDR